MREEGAKKIKQKRKNSKKINRKMFRIIRNAGISLLCALLVTLFVVTLFPLIFNVTLVPGEPRNVALLALLLSLVYFTIAMIMSWYRSTLTKKIVTSLIGSLAGTILMVIAVYIASTFMFLNSTRVGEVDNRIYDVVVMKDSEYEGIRDLKNQDVGILNTDEGLGAFNTLEQSTGLNFQLITVEGGVGDLANNLLNGDVAAITIEESGLNLLYDELEDFESDTRVIYAYKTQNQAYQAREESVPSEPFIVYISGIDQYGKTDSVVGRSDVNQLVVVNPDTHKILLVNTPRDYYVQLSGTTGLKDKLTHAGIYGIETSIKTLEDLYNIKINYYVRVNFDSVVSVVDQIGGIDINSDQSFKALHGNNVYVVEGMNHFNGDQALAYARERYAYETGDRHRGENQQQIMSAIIEKVSNSSTLLANYNNILDSLSGSIQTNIPNSVLIDLFKQQALEKKTWDIQSISVDGTGAMLPTYSMGGNLPLYVMLPNEATLKQAKEKIAEVMDGETAVQ